MSTLKVDTIQDTNAVEMYLCKAWVNFDGTGSVPINGSGNVSSITDNAVGEYTINFSTNFSDTNYATVCTVANTADNFSTELAGAPRGITGGHLDGQVAPTVSNVTINTLYGASTSSNGALFDFNCISVAVFR